MTNKIKFGYAIIAVLFLVIVVAAAATLVAKFGKEAKNDIDKKIQVTTTFYPLAFVAAEVGGDLVEVKNITPAGSEPHDYEPTPKDVAAVYNSKLFVFNGNGLDAWAENIRRDVATKNVVVVRMADIVESLQSVGEDDAGMVSDPHFWLDPVIMQTEADAVANALATADPVHAAAYMQNRDSFKSRLQTLDSQFKIGLANCALRDIITSHNAFNYLGKRYYFNSMYISGLSPDEEPSAQRIGQIADLARQKGIGHIFFETLVDPKLSETVAKEIGAGTLVLNPIEGLTDEEAAAGKNYISIMTDNLVNLRTALLCR